MAGFKLFFSEGQATSFRLRLVAVPLDAAMTTSALAHASLRTRMLLGFLASALLLIVASVVGLLKLGQLQAEFQQLVEVQAQDLDKARTWAGLSEANIQRRIVSLTSDSPEFIKAFTANQAEISKQIDALQKDLADHSPSPQAKQISEDIAQARSKYADLRNALVKRKEAGEDIRGEVARSLIPAMNDYLATIRRYADQMHTELAEASARADEMVRGIRMLQIVLLVAGVGVGTAVALWMTSTITQPVAQAQRHAAKIAEGDLTHQLGAHGRDELGQLQGALQAMQHSLARTIEQVRQAAHQVETASSEISSGSNDLSARTEMAASSIEETGAATQHLAEAVRANADAAQQANQLARSASEVATEGDTLVREVVQSMDEIQKASSRIADIIGVIDGIAFQTNILALNAAVEAARAGEQGRGFAVVAGEVRTLAQRSSTAAKEIRELIAASSEQVERGGALVQRTGNTIGHMVQSVQKVTDIVAEISSSTASQAHTLHEIDQAIRQFDQMTQQNAALVEQSAAAAEALKEQSTQLVGAVSTFQL